MQQRPRRRVMNMRDRVFFVLFILLAGGMFWLLSFDGNSPETRMAKRERLCSDRGADRALSAAETFVRRSLRAPSTAEFPGRNDPAVRVERVADCRFRVSSWVDAQNSFGAMLRSRYVAEIRYDSVTDEWRREDLAMER